MFLSVIICTYNRLEWVNNLLTSISLQKIVPDEVIIVDASKDNNNYTIPKNINASVIKSDKKQLTYQKQLGIKKSKGELVTFLDDDTYLDANYFKNILDVFSKDKNKQIGAVSGYITNEWGILSKKSDWFMKLLKQINIYDGNFNPGSISDSGVFIELNELKPFTGIKRVDFVPGGCTSFRKEVFENFMPPLKIRKYGGEDKAFSRMVVKEWGLYVCGDAKLEHYSAKGGARQTSYSHARSSVLYARIIQKEFGANTNSTFKLRLYFIFFALRIYFISVMMFISVIKVKKSYKWFMRGSGYLVGALKRN